MFQIKNTDSIVASMINRITATTNKLTDFNKGSVTRTILEAAAVEIDEYYQSLLKGLYEAVPVAIYKSFSFDKLAATPASGLVTFTRTAGGSGEITIPAGTRLQVLNSSFYYTVNSDTVLEDGDNTVDVVVTATISGTDSNCLVNTITVIVDAIGGIASVTNASAFINGTEEETANERKVRFQKWLNTLARATKGSIEYAVSQVYLTDSGTITERVSKSLVHEPSMDEDPAGPVGEVHVYLWNGVNGASGDLLTEVSTVLHGYMNEDGVKVPGQKAAGCVLKVYAVSIDTVDVTATITLKTDYTEAMVDSNIETAIDTYFQSLEIGQTLVWARLLNEIMEMEGVLDVELTAPAVNVVPSDWNYICAKGTVSLSYE